MGSSSSSSSTRSILSSPPLLQTVQPFAPLLLRCCCGQDLAACLAGRSLCGQQISCLQRCTLRQLLSLLETVQQPAAAAAAAAGGVVHKPCVQEVVRQLQLDRVLTCCVARL
jgi:hypothetical protein